MKQNPSTVKYKKQHTRRLHGLSKNTNRRGTYSLISLDNFWFYNNQIEACRKTIVKYTKKFGKLLISIFPDRPITRRAEESRMGSGKGNVKYWAAAIKKNCILFEISNVSMPIALKALSQASYKIPVKTKILI